MAIFQGDVIIFEAISRGLEDLRKNPWLIDDVFSSLNSIPIKDKYGQKEIDAAKNWFLNNKIEINLRFRNDKDQFPCVTIALGSSNEKEEMKHLGDLSTTVENLMPNQIGKPIGYILKPFVPESYDPATGFVKYPEGLNPRGVRSGQVLVDPDTAEGYVIIDISGEGLFIEPGLNLTFSKCGVIPKFQTYRVRREHTFFQESYSIGCHVHGDPNSLIWLHSIVLYCILRYRESLLEGQCFTQSSVSSSDLVENGAFSGPSGDNVFSRYITLTGQVENTWLKTPKRVLEAVELAEHENEGIRSGIKILSNLDSPDELDTEDDLWTTIKDDALDMD